MRMPFFILVVLIAACGGDSTAGNVSFGTTSIADIQGDGAASPLVGREVIVEGIVSGDFQDGDNDDTRDLGGFYIQDSGDGDSATSDGVFVYDGNQPATDIAPGNRVRVTGQINEHHGETRIVASSMTVVGSGEVLPTPVSLPVATSTNSDGQQIANLESVEGMLVTFPQVLTVSQLRNFERYGEVLLSEGGRQFAFVNLNSPDVAGYAAHRDAIASRRVHLDDGLRSNNPGSAISIRNGDGISDLTGVVRFARGSGASGTATYRLMPTVEPQFFAANPRPGPPAVDGSIRLATFNVNNYFSTLDSGRSVCGPARDSNCRGADSEEEWTRQIAKIATVLKMMDAHVVALVEVENNPDASLRTIVGVLNLATSQGRYSFIDTGTIGDDAIKVGLLYQPAAVRPVGDFAILDNSVDARFDDNRHRPVLAQTFATINGGHRFTVAANHLKSKGSSCENDGDPDIGDGQSNCSATRSLGAAAMVDWLATDPTEGGTDNIVAIGDFNTHTLGDALARFEIAGYINLAAEFIGEAAYSFEFDGQFGALDHAMASPGLAENVVDVAEWHINADESRIHDYNLEFGRDPSVFNGSSPFRASDHDPMIIGIEF